MRDDLDEHIQRVYDRYNAMVKDGTIHNFTMEVYENGEIKVDVEVTPTHISLTTKSLWDEDLRYSE